MAKGPWRDAIARALGRGDVKERGVGSGRASDNVHGHHKYNEYGITDRQAEILGLVAEHGAVQTAKMLGIAKASVYDAIYKAGERMELDYGTPASEVLEHFLDISSGETARGDPADDAEQQPQNPWYGYYDYNGNWHEHPE